MVGGAFFHKAFESPIQRQELCRVTARWSGIQVLRAEMFSEYVPFETYSFAGVGPNNGKIIDAFAGDRETLVFKAADYIRTAGNQSGPGLLFETLRNHLANIWLWRPAKTFGLGGEFGHMNRQ